MAGAFVAMMLFVILGFFMLMGLIFSAASAKPPSPDNVVLSLDLNYAIPDQAPLGGFAAFSSTPGFTDILLRLKAAWAAHGNTIMADECWGSCGRRPAAWYLVNNLPFRPTTGPTVRVGSTEIPVNTPAMGCEAEHLHRLGIVDAVELEEHVRSGVHGTHCLGQCPHQPQPRRRRQLAHA